MKSLRKARQPEKMECDLVIVTLAYFTVSYFCLPLRRFRLQGEGWGGTLQIYLWSDNSCPTFLILTVNVRTEVLSTEYRTTLYQEWPPHYNLKEMLSHI